MVCNKIFKAIIWKEHRPKYCSQICMGKGYIKECPLSICHTCNKEFYSKHIKKVRKFCSPTCIRYAGTPESRKWREGKGFWQTSSEQEKKQKMISEYERLVIKKEGCWSWGIKTDQCGYARIHMGRGKIMLGHRASWIINNGEIPDSLFVLHKCDNPRCTNPAHLFLGTPKDNTNDCISKGRKKVSFGKTHYNVKLNEDDVREIRKLIKGGFSQSQLAKKFNVSPSCIQSIHEYKTWKNLGE